MTHTLRHTRPVPAEWPDLSAYAEKVIPAEASPDRYMRRWDLFRLAGRVKSLPDAPLEANYYYGVGELMCGIKQLLDIQRVREHVIGTAAMAMVKRALEIRGPMVPLDKPFTPLIGDLHPFTLERPFFRLANAAWEQMPAPQRALTDTLTATTLFRRPAVDRARHVPGPLVRLFIAEEARNSRLTAVQTARNSLTGAVAVLDAMLSKSHPANVPSTKVLMQPICPAALEKVRPSKAFTDSARLRLDEFMAGAGWEGSGDSLRFNAEILKTSPPPLCEVPDLEHLHEERLECPAIRAAGLASDVARNILPSIITTASHIVPGEVFEIRS